MRFVIVLLVTAIIGIGVSLRPQSLGRSTDLDTDIKAAQTEHIKGNSKYLQVKKTVKDGMTYWVDEYVTPSGEAGYQVYVQKPNGSIRSFGEGPEAIDRSFEWTPVLTTTTL